VNYRQPDRPLLVECAEQHATARNHRAAELDLGGDAM
jgi:hypothetical protein